MTTKKTIVKEAAPASPAPITDDGPRVPRAVIAAGQPKTSVGPGVVKKTDDAYNIDPRRVTMEEGWNVRYDMGDIESFAAGIKAQLERDPRGGGLLHPLGVQRLDPKDPLARGGKYDFVTRRGHRRTTSIQLLLEDGVDFPFGVPATIMDKSMSLRDSILEMYVESDQKPWLPLEEAVAFKRLQEGDPTVEPPVPGMTVKEISKATGRSDHHIIATLALLTADEAVVAALKDGTVGKTTARAIAKDARGDKARQRELVALAQGAGKGKGKTAVRDALHAERVKKAAKQGRALKIRALSDAQLSAIGVKLAGEMVGKMKDAGKKPDFDVDGWIRKDDALALAYTYGALQATKAAAGMPVELSV